MIPTSRHDNLGPPRYGTDNGNTKLTDDEVADIRAYITMIRRARTLHRKTGHTRPPGHLTRQQIADHYGISKQHLDMIISGKRRPPP
jgi:hypothetical protein